jgi:hypothetical protein
MERFSMAQLFRSSLVLIAPVFFAYTSYSQNWTKQPLKRGDESLFAIYVWEQHDQNHGAKGEIILTKKGRFSYSAYYPLNFQEHSSGTYQIKKDTLVLTSDLQSDNLKVTISYIDDVGNDTLFTRLRYPVNKKGDSLTNTYYFINKDTSLNSHYDLWATSIDPLTVVKSLKLMFYDTNVGSDWIPVTYPEKYLKVTVLTDINEDDRTYKVLKEWKFKLTGNKLTDLSGTK